MSKLVAVLVPSGEQWSAQFGMSLISALSYLLLHGGGTGFVVRNKRGSILPQLREKLVEDTLRDVPEATHVLFVDSDQTFPAETIVRLLEHEQPVVALNIPVKRRPSTPTARLKGHKIVFSKPHSPRLGEVWRVGMGVMLVEASVFGKLPKPWFNVSWREEVGDFEGEDWWFCRRLEEAGIPILVDHRLSLGVGHVGAYKFTHGDVDGSDSGGAEEVLAGEGSRVHVHAAEVGCGPYPAA